MASRRIKRTTTAALLATSCAIFFAAMATSKLAASSSPSTSSPELRHLLSAEPLQRLRALSKLSDDDGEGVLTRPFGGPAHARAAEEIAKWFEDAGLRGVALDAVGNVRGALSFGGEEEQDDEEEDASVLLLGSHYDTVRGAGAYDGTLGIIAAVAAVKAASRRIAELMEKEEASAAAVAATTRRRRKTVEVVAFSDEEGLRFGTTFLGSSALAGTLLGSGALDAAVDGDGTTLREALLELKEKRRTNKEKEEKKSTTFSSSSSSSSSSLEEDVAACALSSSSRPLSRYRGYVEAHMEQGPTLEAEGARLSAVSGISGQTRLGVVLRGAAGHAGTVPMNSAGGGRKSGANRILRRRDAAAGAAEVVVAVERICEGMLSAESGGERRGGRSIGRATATAAAALSRALGAAASAAAGGSPDAAAARFVDLLPPFLRDALERLRASSLSLVSSLHSFHSSPSPLEEHLVCTVGRLSLRPNAPNVIAGSAELVVDVRSSSDAARASVLESIGAAVAAACKRRALECKTEKIHEARAGAADPGLTAAVERAARASEATFATLMRGGGDGDEGGSSSSGDDSGRNDSDEKNAPAARHVARARASGAGHDALALSAAAPPPPPLPWAMLFVRDVGGASHCREERVRDGDVAAAAAALFRLVEEHLEL